jgi:hypothetical protein
VIERDAAGRGTIRPAVELDAAAALAGDAGAASCWTLAVSPSRLAPELARGIPIAVEGPGGEAARVVYVPRPGAQRLAWRDIWEALLPIVIERPKDVFMGSVDVEVTPEPDPEPSVPGQPASDAPVVHLVRCGRIEVLRPRLALPPVARARIVPKGGIAIVGPLPLGLRYRVTAHDRRSRYSAECTLVHNGGSWTLGLKPGLEVAGLLLPPDGWMVPARMRVTLRRSDPALPSAEPWTTDADDVEPRPGGTFALAGPFRPPHGLPEDTPPPPHLAIEIDIAGYEPIALEAEIGSARTYNARGLWLAPLEPDLLLQQWQGVATVGPGDSALQLDSAPGLRWLVHGWRIMERKEDPAGFLEPGAQPGTFRALEIATGAITERPAPIDAAHVLLLDNGPTNGWGTYARADGRTFRHVDEQEYVVAYDCPSLASGPLWVGYAWQGLSQALFRIAGPESGVRRFSAPPSDVTVWWSLRPTQPEPGDSGGSQAVRPGTAEQLELP